MKKRLNLNVLLLAEIGFLLVVIVFIGLRIYTRINLAQAERAAAPPTVYFTSPVDGTSVPPGEFVTVGATAEGHNPILSIEFWVDGEIFDVYHSDLKQGSSPLFAFFDLPLSEGPHMLFTRALDAKGLQGTSLPVTVYGKENGVQPFIPIKADTSQTLADVAASQGVNADAVDMLNPSLKGQTLQPGSIVKIPPSTQPSNGTSFKTPSSPPLQVIQPGVLNIDTLEIIPYDLLTFVASPTDILYKVSNCKISLRWTDNTSDEMYYEVWMAAPGSSPQSLLKLNSAPGGPVWTEFQAPERGKYSLWVEAVTPTQRLASPILLVDVPMNCPSMEPPQLVIELRGLKATSALDNVYCYLAIDGAQSRRIPFQDFTYFPLAGGQADLISTDPSKRQFVISKPISGTFDIDGECWGWAGGSLKKTGDLDYTVPEKYWNGSELTMKAGSLSIILSVSPTGGLTSGQMTTFSIPDPKIPVPYNLRIEQTGDAISGDEENWILWDWNGDPGNIFAFAIYVDGFPYREVLGAGTRRTTFSVPYSCGKKVRLEVSALGPGKQSFLSSPYEWDLGTCAMFGMVKFRDISTGIVDNSLISSIQNPPCDTIGVSFAIQVNQTRRAAGKWYYSGGYIGEPNYQITCFHTYTFNTLLRHFVEYDTGWKYEDPPDTFRFILKGEDPSLTFGTIFMFNSVWSEPYTFANNVQTVTMPYDQWKTFKKTYVFTRQSGRVPTTVVVDVWTEMNK